MKKILFCFMAIALSLTFVPKEMKAVINSTSIHTLDSYEAQRLVNRLQEIKTLSRSKLTSPQKRKLRKEVLSISERFKQTGTVVYISGGTLILIIVLLIILL